MRNLIPISKFAGEAKPLTDRTMSVEFYEYGEAEEDLFNGAFVFTLANEKQSYMLATSRFSGVCLMRQRKDYPTTIVTSGLIYYDDSIVPMQYYYLHRIETGRLSDQPFNENDRPVAKGMREGCLLLLP